MIAQIIGAMIVVVVGFSLLPTIQEQMDLAIANQTVEPSLQTTLEWTPKLFIVIIIGMAILMVARVFMGNDYLEPEEEEIEEEMKPKKPHRQTYEEYVKERLNVEEMMS